MQVGDELRTSYAFTVEDVLTFARLSGDEASQHQQPDAQGRLIVHGLLTASLPTRIGSRMHIWAREMTCQWRRPVYTDQPIVCVVRVEEMSASARGTRMCVSMQCLDPDGHLVMSGECRGTSPLSLAELQGLSVSALSD